MFNIKGCLHRGVQIYHERCKLFVLTLPKLTPGYLISVTRYYCSLHRWASVRGRVTVQT